MSTRTSGPPVGGFSDGLCACTQVKIWDIPVCGVQQNLTKARKTLIGHSRRVALIEWHPTAENLLLSAAYDYTVSPGHFQLCFM